MWTAQIFAFLPILLISGRGTSDQTHMATFALTLTMLLQIVTSSEMSCLGFIRDTRIPPDVFVAGTREEGVAALAVAGQLVYLNGPGLSNLKPGENYRVVRPEGTLQDRDGRGEMGTYFKSLATIRLERLDGESAVAVILSSCQPIAKGDLVVPATPRLPVEYKGERSTRLTPFPADGLSSVIILAEDDLRELATGQFCFIMAGLRDGVKPGDRFAVFRLPPPFQTSDMTVTGVGRLRGYQKMNAANYDPQIIEMLRDRKISPRPIGDIVVVEAGETSSTARIVNAMAEMHPGDIVVRR